MLNSFHSYIESILSENPTIPAIMDNKFFIYLINKIYNTHYKSLEEIKTANIYSLFFYGILDDKKEFSIQAVRKVIEDTSLKPYSGKHIFILENFDTAKESAQNATLKLIEECPPYAVIILLCENQKQLLPTIKSRTFSFQETQESETLDEESSKLLDDFISGNRVPWISHLYRTEYSLQDAFLILTKVFSSLDFQKQEKCKFFLTSLFTTNEKPRNILEAFFL